jgi:hypothetical protein
LNEHMKTFLSFYIIDNTVFSKRPGDSEGLFFESKTGKDPWNDTFRPREESTIGLRLSLMAHRFAWFKSQGSFRQYLDLEKIQNLDGPSLNLDV